MKLPLVAWALGLALLGGCAGSQEPDPTGPNPSSNGGGPTTSLNEFPAGVYVASPVEQGVNRLRHVDGATIPSIEFHGVGFALSKTRFVAIDDQGHATIVEPSGKTTTVNAQGLYHPGRPSLSPDGTRIVVQATNTAAQPMGADANFEIFIVDLRDGSSTRVAQLPMNEESPEWVPGAEIVIWSSFSPEEGIDLHEHSVVEGREIRTLEEKGALHLDVSPNGTYVLDTARLTVFQRETATSSWIFATKRSRPRALPGMNSTRATLARRTAARSHWMARFRRTEVRWCSMARSNGAPSMGSSS